MDVFKNLQQQLTDQWQRWNGSQRAFFIGALCVAAVMVAGVGYWSTRPEYVRLASDLSPMEAAEVTAALENANISYELSLMGSSILVTRQDLARARSVLPMTLDQRQSGGNGSGSASGFGFGGSFHPGEAKLREQEAALARTIKQFRAVREAIVHIGRPDPSPFVIDQSPTTASVVLTLNRGVTFTPEDAAAVVDLVAHAVEGLDPSHVSLVDTDGRRLTPGDAMSAHIGSQLDYIRRVETALANKAQSLLIPLLGPGHAIVRVTAEVDFDRVERIETIYDSTQRVTSRESIRTESVSGVGSFRSAVTGAAANVPGIDASPYADQPFSVKNETNDTDYLTPKTEDRLQGAPGRITRLTVGAVVDLEAAMAQAPEGTPPLSEDRVRQLIENAVGFDALRGDTISVTVGHVHQPELETAPVVPPPFWSVYADLIHQVALAIAGLAAFVLGWLILRRIGHPVVVKEVSADDVTDAARRLVQLTEQARENPELVARIMSAWLDSPGNEAGGTASPAGSRTRERRAA